MCVTSCSTFKGSVVTHSEEGQFMSKQFGIPLGVSACLLLAYGFLFAGGTMDRCVLYVYRCAVAYANNPDSIPH